MNNDLEQFTDLDLEGMAHGNNPVANAYRELLAFRRAAKQAKPVAITDRAEIAGLSEVGWVGNFMAPSYKGVDKGDEVWLYTTPLANSPAIPDGFTEIQLIKAMTWINRVRRENQNMKEAKTCAELILRFLPASPKPESE